MEEDKCPYCDGTGYIGSPFEIGHYSCTDCEIWEQKIEQSKRVIKESS